MLKKVQQSAAAAQQAHRHGQTGPKKVGFEKTITEQREREAPRRGAASAPATRQARGPYAKISLQHAARLAHFAPVIAHNAVKYGVPLDLICGLMIQESGVNPKAKSHCGATGLMQLMPATAHRMGVTNIHDPAQNIEGGVRYLRYLMDLFKGNIPKVLAGYNAGEGAVQKYGGVPPFAETQNYVPSVMANMRTIGSILGGGQPANVTMRTVVQNTLPRHAIANFTPSTREAPPPLADPSRVARNLARM